MAKMSAVERRSDTGRFVSVNIAARERTVPRSSAEYVFAGGKGEAAYKLTKIIEGSGTRYSLRSTKTGVFLSSKKAS
ncbi:MAG TPA: hypothetical protein VHM92_06500 [Allosphingosinicella sp.]|nr:hypothetical protein [Allosphingosinicella sp.]